MNYLDEIYKRLARDRPAEELATRYQSAQDHGARAIKNRRLTVARTLPMVASATPPAATLDVVVYVLHMLGATTHCDLARRLVDTMVREAQDAISWLSRTLIELDQDSAETANALSEVQARLLAVWVFAETARGLERSV
jgi:hypothetical protein